MESNRVEFVKSVHLKFIKCLFKDWVPPAVIRALRGRRVEDIRFEGSCATWDEAAHLCGGYDAEHILVKVLDAALKVKQGEAAFERDSVLFDEIQYSWPVTAALMWAASKNSGKLYVLDFGGSLGSSYFQNKKFFSGLDDFAWCIVEQKRFVDIGSQYISDDFLSFYSTIEEALLKISPNVILLSSVLQYLPNPSEIIRRLALTGADTIIIDRTPFLNNESESIVKIQHVSKQIYPASYACWFFSKDFIVDLMHDFGYVLIEKFDALDRLSDEATWKGLIFEKNAL